MPFDIPRRAFAVLTIALLAAPFAVSGQSFTDMAGPAGVQITQVPDLNVPIGGGAIWEDFNNDGTYDLYLVVGGDCNRLFNNDGAGNFTEVPNAGGADDCGGLGHGGTAADFDNDGDIDLYVTNWGQNRYYENLSESGTPSFQDSTVAAGMFNDPPDDDEVNSSSAVAGDFDNDGDLDLFVGNHWFDTVPVQCNPDYLWRNEGDGTFTDIGPDTGVAFSGLSGIAGDNGCALGATWSDYDEDGDLDLMVINDFGPQKAPNQLYENIGPSGGPGGWEFANVSAASGFDYVMFGMGIAKADYDLDGDWDYYMVDIGNNNFGQSQISDSGSKTFVDVAAAAGVEARDFDIYGGSDGLVSWGPVFADLDHDGREDLIVTNGGASEENFGPMFGDDYVDQNPNYIYRNDGGGVFTETHEVVGVTNFGYHRTGTVCDYDNDGDLDIHFGVNEDENVLYENDLTDTNWLKVEVEGRVGNRDGVGAKIDIRAGELSQKREVEGGSSFLSLNCRTAHFGLGPVEELDSLEVTFLSGLTFEHRHVPANRSVTVVEPIFFPHVDFDSITAAPGEMISIPMEIGNFSDETAAFQVWVTALEPTGGQRLVRGPVTVSLDAGDSLARTLDINLPDDLAPDTYEMVIRTGGFPGDIVGQTWFDLIVE